MISKEKLTLNMAGTAKACADLHVLENALRAAGGKASRTASCISWGRLFHAREFMVVDCEEGRMSRVGDAEPWLSIYKYWMRVERGQRRMQQADEDGSLQICGSQIHLSPHNSESNRPSALFPLLGDFSLWHARFLLVL